MSKKERMIVEGKKEGSGWEHEMEEEEHEMEEEEKRVREKERNKEGKRSREGRE